MQDAALGGSSGATLFVSPQRERRRRMHRINLQTNNLDSGN
jgi:hypothetical protein